MPLEFASESLAASSPVGTTVTTILEPIHEGETAAYSVQLQGPGAAAIANTDFSAITLTLIDEETRTVINSRNAQDVLGAPGNLGANNVTLSVAALLDWAIQAEDTVFTDPTETRKIIYYRAVFRFEFDIGSGTEIGFHEVRFPIRKAFAATNQSLS